MNKKERRKALHYVLLVGQLEKYQRKLDSMWGLGVPCKGRLIHLTKQIGRVDKLIRNYENLAISSKVA